MIVNFPLAARRIRADQVALARKVLADPARCAARPSLCKAAWLILISAQGRTPCQSRMGFTNGQAG